MAIVRVWGGIPDIEPVMREKIPGVVNRVQKFSMIGLNYINPGYGLSLVDTLWNASSYRQPLEQEGNPMTWIEKFCLQIF